MRQWFLASCFVLATLVGTGCGGPSPILLSGKVTFEGEPVSQGSISFVKEGGEGKGITGAPISNGKYQLDEKRDLQPGTYKVMISWQKATGKKVPEGEDGEMIDELLEIIPAKYNVKTELSETIERGTRELNYDLKK